ncbi:PspA-associated protein PspAA [Nocardioides sp. Bht2]|uniref:PspA-associated protein PspAA n=1 Tax=Nocardioides sp. Bht2 TaxID=3392297 RepID=UPI0039B45877
MIVRILGEGQFDVDDAHVARLNELDDALETAIEADDEAGFAAALAALLDQVRSVGAPHDAEAIDVSDAVLPYAEATLAQVRELLADDGLIPG